MQLFRVSTEPCRDRDRDRVIVRDSDRVRDRDRVPIADRDLIRDRVPIRDRFPIRDRVPIPDRVIDRIRDFYENRFSKDRIFNKIKAQD